MSYTREELALIPGLTEDEIATALEQDQEAPQPEDPKPEPEPAAAVPSAETQPAPAATPPAAASPPAPEPAAPPQAEVITPPKPDPAAERAARLAAIEAEMSAIDDKFDGAELTAKERREQLKPLEAERFELQRKDIGDAAIAQFSAEQAQQNWAKTVGSFLDDHPHYKRGSMLFQTLDLAVQREQDRAREAGKDPNSPDILVAADAAVRAELAALAPKSEPAAKPKPEPAPAAAPATQPAARRPPPEAPPTLARVPAVAVSEGPNSLFALLDRIAENPNPDDPNAFEREMAKLTPEQRDAYLASG